MVSYFKSHNPASSLKFKYWLALYVFYSLLIVTVPVFAVSVTKAEIESNMETIALGWVKAHNSKSISDMTKFRQKYRQRASAVKWQENYQSLVVRFGELKVVGLMQDSDTTFDLIVESTNTSNEIEAIRLKFSFYEDAPEQIRAIELSPADQQESGLPPIDLAGLSGSKLIAKIDSWLIDLEQHDVFSGSVLLANEKGIFFEKAYGMASREYAAKNTLKTRFDVGSINKDYTQLAIMQLLEQGKLTLNDKVGKHLPDYPNADVKSKVSIQQLLDHTSGVGDYFTDEYMNTPMNSLIEIEDYIAIWGSKPLLGKPGEKERYSNFGYTILGAVIEKISGLRYDQYVVVNIFKPAGMSSSGFFETDAIVPDVATGYTFSRGLGIDTDVLRKNTFLEPIKGGPWGKSYSTGRDLYRFYLAMLENRYLKEENDWLNLAWEGVSVGLAGGGPGLNAFFLLEDDLMVIVLANLDPPIAGDVSQDLISALLSK